MAWNSRHSGVLAKITLATLGTVSVPEAIASHPDCLEDRVCSQRIEEGKRAHNEKRYDDAVQTYRSAYAQLPDPALLILLGRSLHKSGDPATALKYYDQARPQIEEPTLQRRLADYRAEAEAALSAGSKLTRFSNRNTSTPDPTGAPAYKRWWFWTILSSAVAVTAVGLGLGLGFQPKKTEPPEGWPLIKPF